MIIKKIKLTNFRNFKDVSLTLSPRLNFFIGENGQGKTNLLESLYLINQGDTFRYADNNVLINKNSSGSFLEEEVIQNNLNYKLKLKLEKTKKVFQVNEKQVAHSLAKKYFNCVIFSPESLSAIKEASDERRKLVDELLIIFNKKNAQIINDYKKALKTRNRLLKQNLEKPLPSSEFFMILESLNSSFIKHAIELTMARIEALNGLKNELNNSMKYISQKNDVDISVEYVVSGENILNFSLNEVSNALQKRLSELQSAEIASGISLVGPHKHDIVFLYDENDSRFYCSQGQQRAIILSFKMAQIVYHRKVHGFYPVLMLDDVLSELDENKRKSLIDFLHEINTQVFITTTDLALPEKFLLEDIKIVKINNGQIVA